MNSVGDMFDLWAAADMGLVCAEGCRISKGTQFLALALPAVYELPQQPASAQSHNKL